MAASSSLSRRLYGTDQPDVESVETSAGAFRFRVQGPQLRGVMLGDTEVLRSVGLVIRDEFWGTHQLHQRACETFADDQDWRQIVDGYVAGIDGVPLLEWWVDMHIGLRGISVCARLRALEDFVTCRAGLMLLHPLKGVVNSPVSVTHSDGSIERGTFPDLIAPAQPFLDIRRLVHSPTPGLTLQWDFSGDVFEMEDQRNWCDASFKTYNRPLAWPCPYRLGKGEHIEQSMSLSLLDDSGVCA
ncbi:hypothetical protein AUC61_22685 [Pseudomonas sp. S25]|uniref:D-apionate lactonase N-terminal domain-containing protein n=1 Tax=Pseudomonas maioricensis TaxID=1766623 RepID=A0ABS9ZP41_9PSED|nr:hypothetical protein [Pseudomonas sp. S25]MCI8212344.1 hypothetical protein [Pseudomonas sp. S25]